MSKGVRLEFTNDKVIAHEEGDSKVLKEGIHYIRWGDATWISLPAFCYALSPENNDSLVVSSSSPPFFIKSGIVYSDARYHLPPGQGRNLTKTGDHYHLPPGKGFLVFQVYDEGKFSTSCSRDQDERDLLEALGKIYKTKKITTPLERAYAIVEALGTLKDGGDRLRYKWMTRLNWSKRNPVASPYGEDERRTALVLHATEAQSLLAKRSPARPFPVFRELLTLARSRKTGTTEGWGDWFVHCPPSPSFYTVKVEYLPPPKHQAVVEFTSQAFKGGYVTLRLVEFGGTITNKMMRVKNAAEGQRWTIELTEPPPTGRGGRDKSNVELRKTQWQGATTLEQRIALLGYITHRKFWEPSPIRYILVDPDHRNLLVCQDLEAPKGWSLEILDDIRYVQDNTVVTLPIAMQLAYVRSLYPKRDEKVDAVLHLLFTSAKTRIELRCELFRLLSGGTWLGGREAWEIYCKAFKPVEAEMAVTCIESCLTSDEKTVGKLELLEEFVLLSMNEPYDFIRPALIKAIDAVTLPPSKKARVEEEEDDFDLSDLKHWADVERNFYP